MATEANQVVQNSSATAGGSSPNGGAGTSGGNAGSTASGAPPGIIPTAAPVAARTGFRVALQQMLQGFQAVIPGGSSVTTSAGSLAQADVVARLQGYLGAYTALDAQTTAHKQARLPVVSQLSEAKQFYALLKMAVANQFGPQSPMLEQFGIKPKKARRALTASQLAVQAAKLMATRKLRGTKGALQKASIKAGPMKFVDPVADTAASTAPGTSAASTALPDTAVGAVGPPPGK